MSNLDTNSWRSRRVKSGQIRAGDLIPHPSNPKFHPQKQRDAVAGSISDLGQIAPIIININNGYLVDGHERAWQALQEGEDTLVDADWVDLTEDEHNRALIILDAVGQLFTYDRDSLDNLLKEVQTDDARLQVMLSELATNQGITPPDFSPIDASELPRLDQLEPKWVTCPHCGEKVDAREHAA